ncbi:MAG: tetratricopeptide repeat protein [Alphaproteobacteria bacterium]
MRGLLPAPSLFLFLLALGGCAEVDTQIDASIKGEVSTSQTAKQDITTDWLLGEPDLLLHFPQPYILPAGNTDAFRSFVIPNVSSTDLYVSALDFNLPNQHVVHHAEFRLDVTNHSREKELEDSDPGFRGMDNSTARFPDGHFVNWVPGKEISEARTDLAWRLPAGADLVVQLHMMPRETDALIQPQIGLYLSKGPAELNPEIIWLGSRWLPIAAGESNFKTSDNFVLPAPVEVISILPHCHTVCGSVNVWATLPNGSVRELLHIEEWDFYKQIEKRFLEQLLLPAGTNLAVEFTYNNSSDNPQNPHSPPQAIQFGPRSDNEMADLWIQVFTQDDSDRITLRKNALDHIEERTLYGLEQQISIDPSSTNYIQLGLQYQNAGQTNDAVAQYQHALELTPDNTAAVNHLAIALAELGRRGESQAQWARLIELNPDSASAHFDLGMSLAFSNQVSSAESHLQQAINLDPEFDSAFLQLGLMQAYLGRFDEALSNLQSALSLNSNEPMILRAIAQLMATHPTAEKRQPKEAIALAEKALNLLSDADAWSLSVLASAHAANGDFDLATEIANQARSKVEPREENSLGLRIDRQIFVYQQGQLEVARAAN